MPPKRHAPKPSTSIAAPPPDDDDDLMTMDFSRARDSGIKLISELIAESGIDMPPEEVERQVEEFSAFSDQSDWTGIAPYFNALSSIARKASNYENWDTRFRVYRYIISCFGGLVEAVQDQAHNYVSANTEDRRCNVELANAVSMIVILAQRYTVQLQLYVSKSIATSNAGKRGKARNVDLDSDIVDWKENQRSRMIKHLLDLLEMSVVNKLGKTQKALQYIYAPDTMEDDLIARFMAIVTQLLEDPENAVRSNQDWLMKLFCISRVLAQDYGMAAQVANSLFMDTFELPYLETSTTYPFIEPLVTLMNQGDPFSKKRQHPVIRSLLEMVVRRACGLYSGARADRPPPRAFCMMIQALAIHCPDVMLQDLTSVFKLLENQHVNVRMSTLQAIGDLFCCHYLSNDLCNQFPGRRKKRLNIFLKICRHMNDEGTNVRTKAVSLLRSFMEAQKIPEEFQSMGFVAVVGGRLNDKSVQVRKASIQFLTVFLDNQSYGHDFTRSVHFALLETKRADMRRLAGTQPRTLQDAQDDFNRQSFNLRRDITLELGAIFRNEAPINDEDEALTPTDLYTDLDVLKAGAKIARFYVAKRNFEFHESKRSMLNLNLDQLVEQGTKRILAKAADDYEDFRIQMMHANDEELLEDEQAAEDRNNQANLLKAQVLQLVNKMAIEVELSECLKLALRCVSMGETAEIKEGIKFLARCKLFGIEGADDAIRSMCSLVWRPTADVIQELLEAAEDMFISRIEDTEDKSMEKHKSTVESLMSVMHGVTDKDRPSVEEVIFLLAADEIERPKAANRERRKIHHHVIALLWRIVNDNSIGNNDRKITALRILYAISRSEAGIREARQKIRFLQAKLNDVPEIAVEALRIISILGNTTAQDDKEDAYNRPLFRIHQDDSVFKSIEALFFREVVKADDSESRDWFGIIRLTIHTFLNVSMDVNVMLPKLAAHFLYRAKKVSEFFLFYSNQAEEATSDTRKKAAEARRDYWALTWCRVMEKLMAFCGEVAVQLHAYIQVTLPRLHTRYYTKMTEAAKNDSKVREEPVRLITDLEKSIAQKKTIFSIPQDLSPANASNDLYHTVSVMCDKRLFVPAKLLGRLLPIVVYGMRANTMPARIRYAAQVAFAKYMPLSSEISAFAAPTFFSLMTNAPDNLIRCNMIASCCDFAFSQPTLFELYAPILFKMSRDPSPFARESTVLVLSHLMSNDMIQTRGVLSEPARCICDPVRVVREAAQSFFRELNIRSDTVTQLLPEFLYRLACSAERLPVKSYKMVFEFLITLTKEKAKSSADAMIDRVCTKFSNLDMNDTEGPMYLLIALNKFLQNEGALARLQDNWRHWSKFLCHPNIAREYRSTIEHMLSGAKSEEFKVQCTELIDNIDKIQAGGLRKEDVTQGPSTIKRGRGRKPAAGSETPGPSNASAAPTPSKTPRRKRARTPVYDESESSAGEESSDSDMD